MPFSSRSLPDEPVGYSIDLCRALVTAIGKAVDRDLKIDWVLVTSASRLNAVVKGDVDLECGSTTRTAERELSVAFSPRTFSASTKLLVRKGAELTRVLRSGRGHELDRASFADESEKDEAPGAHAAFIPIGGKLS